MTVSTALPETIAGFRIGRVLGRGGMGVVVAADHPQHGPVALKLLEPTEDGDGAFAARFAREAEALARLDHPNLARLLASGTHGDRLWLAMELVEGPALADLLATHGRLGQADAVRVALQVALALDHAWTRAKLVHRDIKPGNVLIAHGRIAKVIDFGLAREGSGTDLTMAGAILGTPAYMAPEQIRGDHRLDVRTDLYALGGTLFHLLTGRMPYPDPAPVHMVRRHLQDPVPDPLAVVSTLHPAVGGLVRRSMAKAADDRHRDAAAFAAACRDALRVLGESEDAPLDLQVRSDSDVLRRPAAATPASTGRKGTTTRELRPQTESKRMAALERRPVDPRIHAAAKPTPATSQALPWWWWVLAGAALAIDLLLVVMLVRAA